jgi:hypothetical protein
MAGIRLHHPVLTSCTYVVQLEQPFHNGLPRACPRCAGKVHQSKSVHLTLDDTGHVIVSPEVFATLLTVHLAGMEVTNEVDRPPPQEIGAVALDTARIVDARLNSDHNADAFYTPPRTKYQSRDLLRHNLLKAKGN